MSFFMEGRSAGACFFMPVETKVAAGGVCSPEGFYTLPIDFLSFYAILYKQGT